MRKLTAAQRREFSAIQAWEPRVLEAFVANPGGEEAFIASQAHEIMLFGANNSGKTYCGIVKCGHHIVPEKDRKTGKPTGFTIHPSRRIRTRRNGILGWISCYSQDIQKDSIDTRVEKILQPYATNAYKEKGVYQYMEFETGVINFKTQTQDTPSHKAAKCDFIHADEPHRQAIYNEYLSRLLDRKGTMWSTLTPVIDAKSSALKAAEIVWYKTDIIDPYLRNPDSFPLRDVIFLPIEENARWMGENGVQFARDLFASMSDDEQNVRLTGMPIDFRGDVLLNRDMVAQLEKFLRQYQDISQPEIGEIVYDDKENDDDLRMQFIPTKDSFPLEPDIGYAIKIWEHPVEFNKLGSSPVYVLAGDPAEGIPGRDYTAAYVIRSDTGDIVAGLHGYLTELQLAKELWKLGWYYSNYDYRRSMEMPALLVLELMGIGQATMQYLLNGYSDMNIEPYERVSIYRAPDIEDLKLGLHAPGRNYGWKTSPTHRGFLMTQMRIALQNSVERINRPEPQIPEIRDLGWIHDAKYFVMDQQGKYQHAVGFHDDHLFAKALADMGAKQGVFTVPRHVVPERERKEDKILYIPLDYYKNPQGPIPVMYDHEVAKEKVGKKNENRTPVAWV